MPTVRTYSGEKWFFGSATSGAQAHPVVDFLVPSRLVRIEAVFTAEVQNHTLKKSETLSFSRTWHVDDHSDSVTSHDFHLQVTAPASAAADPSDRGVLELCAFGKDGEVKPKVDCSLSFEYASKVVGWVRFL